jgi:hypothetical protein
MEDRMNEDQTTQPGIATRIGWFFWRNWNRFACATRGHRLAGSCICQRCGLPVPTWAEINALQRQIADLEAELGDERVDRKAFHQYYLEAEADAQSLASEHGGRRA